MISILPISPLKDGYWFYSIFRLPFFVFVFLLFFNIKMENTYRTVEQLDSSFIILYIL